MISELYQRELNALREKAVEFSRKYPAYAPHLGGASSDPDVERILEGVAYLGAGIQERLDSGFPQLAQSLLNLVAPQYIEEIPATTIMAFEPKSILKEPLLVPKGTFIDSRDVQGVKCRFTTTYDLTVLPMAIKDVSLETFGDRSGTLSVQINMLAGYGRRFSLSDLSFLAADDYLQASSLFYLLKTCVQSMSVVQGGQRRTLPGCRLDSLGTDDRYPLLSRPSQSLPTYQRLTEYYVNKYNYLYFRLASPNAQALMVDGGNLTIEFHLKNLRSKMPRVGNDSLKLFTVPAVNLFPHDSEPVQVDQREADLLLQPARNVDKRYQIHSVQKVTGHNRQTATRSTYQPLSLLSKSEANGGVYELNRQFDADAGTTATRLNLSYPDSERIPQRETLTASLTCSNGSLASELKQGDVSKGTQNTSELVEFSNLLAPTGYVPPRSGNDLWSLLSHLTINYLPMATLENLKGLLRLYLPQHSADIYLFGEVLHRLLTDFATVNAYVELTITDLNSAEELVWTSQTGHRSLI